MNIRGTELIRIPFFVVTSSGCGGLLVRWKCQQFTTLVGPGFLLLGDKILSERNDAV